MHNEDDPDATDEVYLLYIMAYDIDDLQAKVLGTLDKYDFPIMILGDAVDIVEVSRLVNEDGSVTEFRYNDSSNIDWAHHYIADGPIVNNPMFLEPFFVFDKIEAFQGNCGFKNKNINKLYKNYEAFFAARECYTEASYCKQKYEEIQTTKV